MSADDLRPSIRMYIQNQPIYPALPRLAEFATVLNRVHNTQNTRDLHGAFMRQAIRVRDLPEDADPPRGVVGPLPDLPPAAAHRGRAPPVGDFEAILRDHLVRQQPVPPLGGVVGDPAIQFVLPAAGAH